MSQEEDEGERKTGQKPKTKGVFSQGKEHSLLFGVGKDGKFRT